MFGRKNKRGASRVRPSSTANQSTVRSNVQSSAKSGAKLSPVSPTKMPLAASKVSAKGATRSKMPRLIPFYHYLEILLSSLKRLVSAPLSSLMTVLVIAIALAMPAILYLVVKNMQVVGTGWDDGARMSLFLRQGLNSDAADKLAGRLLDMPEVLDVRIISPDQALAEFKKLSGLDNVDDMLDDNPFPTVLVIEPTAQYASSLMIEPLLNHFRAMPEVQLAQLDMLWLQRWNRILDIGGRAVWLLALLLSLGVVLVIGNTIRMAVQNRRDEIVIHKLIGATDRFIRRPFVYSGFWYGLTGAFIAAILVTVVVMSMQSSVQALSLLYGSAFSLAGLGFTGFVTLIMVGSLLGLIGARFAVGWQLKKIEPT